MASPRTAERVASYARAPKPLPRGLYSVQTASEYLSVSKATFNRWLYTGRINGFKIGPKLRRFTQAELDSLIEQLQAESEAS